MAEPIDDPDAASGRPSMRTVWWAVLAGMALPVLVGLAQIPFRGRAAFDRCLVSVLFTTVPVVVVGVVGLNARRATFVAAALAGYGALAGGLLRVGADPGVRVAIEAATVPLWAAVIAAGAAGVTAVVAAAVRGVRRRTGGGSP